jgi:hypothetical protein
MLFPTEFKRFPHRHIQKNVPKPKLRQTPPKAAFLRLSTTGKKPVSNAENKKQPKTRPTKNRGV